MTIELKETFKRCGVTYEMILNDGKWYIYRCIDDNVNGTYYEVFKRNIIKHRTCIDGKWASTDDTEVRYPSDECFGVWAWCCNTLERAMKYVNGELPYR